MVGARPQFIKAAAVSRALKAAGGLEEILLHTGQHYDDNMSDVFFRELGIPRPQRNLGIGSGSHAVQTGRMLEGIEQAILEERPDWVLVFGDTNSTLAAALAAAKVQVRVAHVEAGLRSFNRRMPEEINRQVTDHLSDLLFAPTDVAVRNLANEGIAGPAVVRTGDVMYDATLHYSVQAEARSEVLSRLGLTRGTYVLATIHRAENTGEAAALAAIFGALGEIAREMPVIVPLHPRTRKALGQTSLASRLVITEPVGFLDMLQLEKYARLIVTDSGGVQKEAYFHRVPCVTLRGETEWTELVEIGWNTVQPPTSAKEVADAIRAGVSRARQDWRRLYGDGQAGASIASALLER